MKKIIIGIIGYGNLGRGVEYAVSSNSDMELKGIFTRRSPKSIKTALDTPVYSMDEINNFTNEIDVMILCGGSATDLPEQAPQLIANFNIVDSYDNHAKIPDHFAKVDEIAKKSGKVGMISVGWDPGLFSLQRLLFESVLSNGHGSTFWGKGVSQGHSDAIRRVDGVLDGKQYTIPNENALDKVRAGEGTQLTTREKHFRECFVVAKEGADKARIEKEIKEMPNYFADYNTAVNFISAEELEANHSKISHGGFVIHSGTTGDNGENRQLMEFSIKLDSNPEFTASVLTSYARATYKLYKEGIKGAKTVFDIPIGYLSQKSPDELRGTLL